MLLLTMEAVVVFRVLIFFSIMQSQLLLLMYLLAGQFRDKLSLLLPLSFKFFLSTYSQKLLFALMLLKGLDMLKLFSLEEAATIAVSCTLIAGFTGILLLIIKLIIEKNKSSTLISRTTMRKV